MNKSQCRRIVDEVLEDMGHYSPEASLAIMMIIAHESKRGEYWFQIRGPALGLIQMEPTTHDSIWLNADSILRNARRLGIKADVKQLYKSLEYNVFMARQYLLMDTRPIPKHEIVLSAYLKEYWNTHLGRATKMSYYEDYKKW